ncbi:MAG: DNA repair protein RecO [Clostridiales bacterium]|nr:DNA repair protein RecO [Clostridiales bacterium]
MNIQGLVLRSTTQGDYNKIINILTPNGKMSAICYRAKRAKSELLPISQPFIYANFNIAHTPNRGLDKVINGEIISNFFDVCLDLDKLTLATNFCKIAEFVSQENTNTSSTLQLLLNTLYSLTKRDDLPTIDAIFHLRLSCILGYTPQLFTCVHCKNKIEGNNVFFDKSSGGVLCHNCNKLNYSTQNNNFHSHPTSDATPITAETLEIMRFITSCPAKKIYAFKNLPDDISQFIKQNSILDT